MLLSVLTFLASSAPWTGNMHPQIGFPDNCDITKTNNCAPSYSTLQSAGVLWPCPDGASTTGTCASTGCVTGSGGNPVCNGLNATNPCCCAKQGCYVQPLFNWIIGVCKNNSCACGSSTAPSCGNGKCGGSCNGASVPCCFGNDVSPLVPFYSQGSHVKLNYIASYQFDSSAKVWRIQQESAFNTDAKYGVYDLMLQYGGLGKSNAWLAPQPGGSVYWSVGYYPAGVKGVGPPGVMFVMSAEEFWGATWYLLNQLSLERGPGVGYPSGSCKYGNDNCWAAGNAGEMDFLEPAWNDPGESQYDYTHSFSTQCNQMGRCFNGGVNCGGFSSPNYLVTSSPSKPEAIIYVAIVDSVGNYVYRIPADQAASIWPGMDRKQISETLQAAPSKPPTSVNPCNTDYCYTFTSNCQATNWDDAHSQNCAFNGQQGFCGNWWAQMSNTGQPLFPGANCVKDVRGGKTMPWCKCMIAQGNCTLTESSQLGTDF